MSPTLDEANRIIAGAIAKAHELSLRFSAERYERFGSVCSKLALSASTRSDASAFCLTELVCFRRAALSMS